MVNIATGRRLASLGGHFGTVVGASCHPTDASMLATASVDQTVLLWRGAADGGMPELYPAKIDVPRLLHSSLSFSSRPNDAKRKGPLVFVTALCFDAKGTLLCCGCNTGYVHVLSLDLSAAASSMALPSTKQNQLAAVDVGSRAPITSIAYAPSGGLLAVCSTNGFCAVLGAQQAYRVVCSVAEPRCSWMSQDWPHHDAVFVLASTMSWTLARTDSTSRQTAITM